MQANDTSSAAMPTANIANDINQLRRDLHKHARDYCRAFSRHYQSLIKDSGQRAEEWYTQHVLDRLYTPGRDYAKDGADGDEWLDGPYGCPIISDFFQVKVFLYDLDGGSTTVYSPILVATVLAVALRRLRVVTSRTWNHHRQDLSL